MPPLDSLGPEGDFVLALSLAPLLRAVRVAYGHAHDRDRGVHAAEWDYTGNAPSRADDDLAADLLPQDPVRRSDVARALGRDRRRLEPESALADRLRGLVHDRVLRRAAILEREVVARKRELRADDVR